MYFKNRLSIEEKLLIKILLKKEKIIFNDFKNINFDLLIKIASAHLILPALYFNICKKRLDHFLPNDLKKFLKYIFDENVKRNETLKEEINYLTKLLKTNNISHLFTKGAHNIKNKLYNNIGERMIGDIDFLVDVNDLNLAQDLLLKNGYKNSKVNTKKFWIRNHIPKLINTKKLFSVEIHHEQLRYFKRRLLPAKELLKLSNLKETNYLIKLCILNYQVNDYGTSSLSYSYRSIYDYVLLSRRYQIKSDDLKIREIRNFFLITDSLGVTHKIKKFNLIDKLVLIRFYFKKSSKFYYLIDNFIINIIKILPKRFLQFLEFIYDKNYRNYILKKLRI